MSLYTRMNTEPQPKTPRSQEPVKASPVVSRPQPYKSPWVRMAEANELRGKVLA